MNELDCEHVNSQLMVLGFFKATAGIDSGISLLIFFFNCSLSY